MADKATGDRKEILRKCLRPMYHGSTVSFLELQVDS